MHAIENVGTNIIIIYALFDKSRKLKKQKTVKEIWIPLMKMVHISSEVSKLLNINLDFIVKI